MANKVVIDVEARFVDNVSGETGGATKSVEGVGKAAENAQKKLNSLSKQKAHPIIDADNNRFLKKMRDSENKIMRLAGKTATATLKVVDKGVDVVNKVEGGLRKVAGKTWTAMVKIKDYATAPLRKIKDSLFSIKSLIAAITAGFAAKKLVFDPISLADSYSGTKIGFSTLLGDTKGQQMMDAMDDFAKKTPFKTSGVISNAQKMMAYGWDPEKILEDMETIGDAAAATGKMDQGLESIVYALSEIRSKGKLSTQELNQLASAGIKAKAYLAEGLGYGTSDAGMKKLAEDLEDGAIGANQAIELILEGMKEFNGMMDRTANETVEGLKSQLEDTFEINIARRWGQGLQDGAKRGLGSIVELLDKADTALSKFGDTVYEVGKAISNWAADKLENAVKRITDITGSFEFSQASLGGKLKMLWKGVISDPLKDWWEGGGREKTAETAGKIGKWIGTTLTKGLLAVLGVTDLLEDSNLSESGGMSVAQSFAKGFAEGFDASAITDKLVEAISNVWGALPTWAKIALGIYGGAKVMGGISSLAGGVASFVGGAANTIGGFSIASSLYPHLTSAGTGILGAVGKAGVGLGASTTGGALLAGSAGIAGGVAGGIAAGKGIYDLYGSYKAYKAGDKTEARAKGGSGLSALGGAATGAAVGSILGPIGTLVGAGIGGVAGLWAGSKWADKIRKDAAEAKYETKEMQEVMSDTNATAEEMAQNMDKAVWNNLRDHFGDIELSMSEIKRIAEQITIGNAAEGMEKFKSATNQAQASLQSLKSASETVNKWMWKAGLGVKFNDDETESIKKAFDDYISSAKSYVENKHYEFTAAVSLLVDVEGGTGKDILESGNSYYTKIQEKLGTLGTELQDTLDAIMEDGVISTDNTVKFKIDNVEYELNEQEALTKLQQEIAKITEKLANAEADAKLETIKIKFGGEDNISYESFENLQTQLKATLEDQIASYDEALTASITSLNLQLEDRAISQPEYDKQLQALMDGYDAKVEAMKVKVTNMQLEILGDSYSDILGEDGLADLQHALQNAIDTGIDPIEWSDEKIAKLLGLDSIGPETAETLRRTLQAILDGGVPDQIEKTVGVDITGEPEIMNKIDVVAEEFGIPKEKADTIALLLYGDKELLNKIDVSELAKEFGIPESQAKKVIEKLTGEKSIENKIKVIADDFGIPDVVNKTVKVNVKGSVTTYGNPKMADASKQAQLFFNQARGGIIDASGLRGFAAGGMVRGGGQLVRVAEEGTPEMIIPLGIQRRERGLKLWEKAGQMMNVPGFARGGLTSGRDEGLRFRRYNPGESSGGQSIQIDVGGITFEIQVNGTDAQSIAEAIKAQVADIAEDVAGVMADAFAAQFENTPTRGGAA